MLNLDVHIDPNSGFCFGVVYAIEMAEDILDQQGYLYCLGDIVHNDEEVKRLEKKGLRIIDYEVFKSLQNEKVLIRAHGEPPSTYKIAAENQLELVDASCPVVLKLQNRIKNAHDKKENIYIYGKHGHAEVVGLMGQTHNSATVFQDIGELDMEKLPSEITLFSQTTKSTDSFYQMANKLESAGVKVNTNDTICRQVSNRDKELREFVKNYDAIIFVSGVKSSNGKSLFKVCLEQNPFTYFVTHPEQLDAAWFFKNNRVGICGATSTPMWLMEVIKDKLKKL
jgi:4-hydroxy-3-methylbut-2-en-1-yl diphosphate reductase